MNNKKIIALSSFGVLVISSFAAYYFFSSKEPKVSESNDDLFAEEDSQKKSKGKFVPRKKVTSSYTNPNFGKKNNESKSNKEELVDKTPIKTSNTLVKKTLEEFDSMPGANFIGPQLKGMVNELYKELIDELDLADDKKEDFINHLVNTEKLRIKILQDAMLGKKDTESLLDTQKQLYNSRQEDLKSLLGEEEIAKLDEYKQALPEKVENKYIDQRLTQSGIDPSYREEAADLLKKTTSPSIQSSFKSVGSPLQSTNEEIEAVKDQQDFTKQLKSVQDSLELKKKLGRDILPEDQLAKLTKQEEEAVKILTKMSEMRDNPKK
jgi:hypothetical protein